MRRPGVDRRAAQERADDLGVDTFTIGPAVAAQLLREPLTEAAVAEFTRAAVALT